MRYKKIGIAILTTTLFFSGCMNQKDENKKSIQKEESVTQIEGFNANDEEDDKKKITTSINAFLIDEKDEKISKSLSSLGNKIEVSEEKELEFKLKLSCQMENDKNANIPIRLYVMADNKQLEYTIKKSDVSYDEKQTFEVKNNKNADIQIAVRLNPNIKVITFLVSAFPDEVPKTKEDIYSGMIAYPIINEAYEKNTNKKEITGQYIPIKNENLDVDEEIHGLDITTKKITNKNLKIEDTHFGEDTVVQKEKGGLFVVFSSETSDDYNYHLFVMCDGKLLQLNQKENGVFVQCEKGTKIFQYEIPKELLPETGTHVFQAVAIPETKEFYGTYYTNKIRIIIK